MTRIAYSAAMATTGGQGSAVRIVWDDDLGRGGFGPEHPMHPLRLRLTAALARDLGLFSRPGVRVSGAGTADDAVLSTVHTAEYIRAVRACGTAGGAGPAPGAASFGLGTEDVPVHPGMHEAAARIVAGTLAAVDDVLAGRAQHAVNFAGGMHHAMAGRASGFCVYNDAAVAIARALRAGVERIAYIDLDAHHGDGVQELFWDDPRVLTVSVHETGRVLFPGTGFAEDTGGPHAPGSAINLALPPGTGDAAWLRALDAVVPGPVAAFAPQLLVTQHGADGHRLDEMSDLSLSVDGQRQAVVMMHALAHDWCDGLWVALGGGGYEPVRVVPRVWCQLVAVAEHLDIPEDTPVPASWREATARLAADAPPGAARARLTTPSLMGDAARISWRPWQDSFNPDARVDRAVLATRKCVYPLWGLDLWLD